MRRVYQGYPREGSDSIYYGFIVACFIINHTIFFAVKTCHKTIIGYNNATYPNTTTSISTSPRWYEECGNQLQKGSVPFVTSYITDYSFVGLLISTDRLRSKKFSSVPEVGLGHKTTSLRSK